LVHTVFTEWKHSRLFSYSGDTVIITRCETASVKAAMALSSAAK